jgi:hypothetical protein
MQIGAHGILLFVVLALSGCKARALRADDVLFSSAVPPESYSVGPASLSFTLRDASGKPIDGAELSLEGDMSHPGIRPSLGRVEGRGQGVYAGKLDLTRAGDWFVRVWGTLPGGRSFERTVALKGVQDRTPR